MKITTEEFQAAFADLAQPLSILQRIAIQITEATGVTLDEMRDPTRTQMKVRARQLLMFKAMNEGVTSSVIGEFINRDHTTVLHGVNKIKQAMEKQ